MILVHSCFSVTEHSVACRWSCVVRYMSGEREIRRMSCLVAGLSDLSATSTPLGMINGVHVFDQHTLYRYQVSQATIYLPRPLNNQNSGEDVLLSPAKFACFRRRAASRNGDLTIPSASRSKSRVLQRDKTNACLQSHAHTSSQTPNKGCVHIQPRLFSRSQAHSLFLLLYVENVTAQLH